MKAKLTILTINRESNLVVDKDEAYFKTMEEAINKVAKLDKHLIKNHFRFSYTLDDIEEAE